MTKTIPARYTDLTFTLEGRSYIKVELVAIYHANYGAMRIGDTVKSILRFHDFDEARQFILIHNEEVRRGSAEGEDARFHYTGFSVVSVEGRYPSSFLMLDISELWGGMPALMAHFAVEPRIRNWVVETQINELLLALRAYNRRGFAALCATVRAQIDAIKAPFRV